MPADNELLRRYCSDRSESAFAELVERHADLVYSAALHQLNGNPDLARDVAQVVFADLALKAASLRPSVSVAGWLYTSARFTAAKLVRSEQRRQAREQKALAMDDLDFALDLPGADATRLRPAIEEAMQDLTEEDREAVLLRYFENRDFKSVGTALAISDEAARKRVVRALERLRTILEGRGISSSESALTATLSGVAALSAPAELHASLIRSALAVSTGPSPGIASNFFHMTPLKTAVVLAGLAVGLGAPALLQRGANLRLQAEKESLARQLADVQAAQTKLRARHSIDEEELARLRKEHPELLRLRDEVGRLRLASREEAKPRTARTETEDQTVVNQQVTIEAKFAKLPAPVLKKLALEATGIDVSGAGVAAILTGPQLSSLVHAFERQAGAEILGTPRVTTMNNRQARVESVETAALEAVDTKLGPSLDVMPAVSADRQTIHLLTTARLAELTSALDNTGAERKQVVQTAVSGNAVLKDGQTAVLCQWVGRSENANSTPGENPACLVVLVTPTLIDPAGNRIHPVEEIAAQEIITGTAQPSAGEFDSPQK
ncbi:MAG TPA: sigma-70 family RNA polymerase sigma factor [Verrucomicrobiae bacterium]|nr:sigma-70 family RNA polymerase sigma factor [Verrucomicrobiae bacterium]